MTLQFENGCSIKKLVFLAGFIVTFFSPLTYGEGGEGKKGEKAVVVPGAVYYNLAPSFVVSFQGEKRLRFLKVDVTLRLQSMETQEQLLHQMPRVRNDLIMLFSSQPETSLLSAEGKEKLRQDSLKKIRELLANEGKSEDVLDVLFMNFVVQN